MHDVDFESTGYDCRIGLCQFPRSFERTHAVDAKSSERFVRLIAERPREHHVALRSHRRQIFKVKLLEAFSFGVVDLVADSRTFE